MSRFYTSTRGAGAASPLPNLTGSFIDEGYLELVELLSTEADNSSQVYHAFDTTTHISYAVKCMRNAAPGSPRAADLQRELDLHQSVATQRGVATLNFSFVDNPRAGGDNEYLFLVLNPAGGDLSNSILQRQMYVDRPRLVKESFLMLADAVAECHNAGVYHRDLRPRNVWCDAEGGSLRIANFEKATREEKSEDFWCGDLAYMSPECANSTGAGASYSPRESDLWALAVILFNIVTSSRPWLVPNASDESYAAYRADEEHHFIDTFHITPAANSFFRRCFAAQAADRPTLDDMTIAVLEIDDRFSLSRRLVAHSHSKLFLRPVSGEVIGDVRFLDRQRRSVTARARFMSTIRRM
ncbi:kinase-like domain-containing protein [Mycena albidolilacea]|uniref:Kinase-like domain-containing protein n=1 Tax=Mycena albidolilacea TaxID=1033008 RepID=A0AAD7ALK8_9AGAR|nr:kinase-like domain-containing protein [Mycena albidolilacea]